MPVGSQGTLGWKRGCRGSEGRTQSGACGDRQVSYEERRPELEGPENLDLGMINPRWEEAKGARGRASEGGAGLKASRGWAGGAWDLRGGGQANLEIRRRTIGTFIGMKHALPGSSPRTTSSLSRGHSRTSAPPGPFPRVTSPGHWQQDLPNLLEDPEEA